MGICWCKWRSVFGSLSGRKPSTVEEKSDSIADKLQVLDQRLASKVSSFLSCHLLQK